MYSPRSTQIRLAWRLLLAKIQNNQAFEAAWQEGEHQRPSVEALDAACGAFHLSDHALLAHFLGIGPQQLRSLLCPGRKSLHKKNTQIAAAIVLRAKYNRRLEVQVAPWLNSKAHAL